VARTQKEKWNLVEKASRVVEITHVITNITVVEIYGMMGMLCKPRKGKPHYKMEKGLAELRSSILWKVKIASGKLQSFVSWSFVAATKYLR
jgi:hypothetical protein